MEKVTITISREAAEDLWKESRSCSWDKLDGTSVAVLWLWEGTHHELVEELGKAFGGENG